MTLLLSEIMEWYQVAAWIKQRPLKELVFVGRNSVQQYGAVRATGGGTEFALQTPGET